MLALFREDRDAVPPLRRRLTRQGRRTAQSASLVEDAAALWDPQPSKSDVGGVSPTGKSFRFVLVVRSELGKMVAL